MPIEDRIRAGLEANAEGPPVAVEENLVAVGRRYRRRVRVRAVIGVVTAAVALAVAAPWLLGLGGEEQPEPAVPVVPGTYEVEVRGSGDTRTMAGTWVVTLEARGAITYQPPATTDITAGTGETYRLSGSRFVTNAFLTQPGCQRSSPPVGEYLLRGSADALAFDLVRDTCAERVALFAARWERVS